MPVRRAQRRRNVRVRLRTSLAALILALAACDAGASGSPDGSPGDSLGTGPTRVPQQTAVAGDATTAAATGPWRRVPFVTDPSFGAAQEAGCRHGVVPIGSTAARIVTDVRGEGRVLLVFALPTKAFLCVTSIDHPESPDAVIPLAIPTTTLADDGIDIVYDSQTGTGVGTIAYAVGRVGPTPTAAIMGFVDQTFLFGALGGGWYSMWWHPTIACDGIAAVNNAHIVLNSTHASCEGTNGPSPST
jgi:hypothetical protein